MKKTFLAFAFTILVYSLQGSTPNYTHSIPTPSKATCFAPYLKAGVK